MHRISWLAEKLFASQETQRSMEVDNKYNEYVIVLPDITFRNYYGVITNL
jgi:hypothetical protein